MQGPVAIFLRHTLTKKISLTFFDFFIFIHFHYMKMHRLLFFLQRHIFFLDIIVYARIYYRMSTYLQAVTCLVSQVLAIACLIDVRGVCNEEEQHKRCGVIRNILNII
jgi:hypothetical protein